MTRARRSTQAEEMLSARISTTPLAGGVGRDPHQGNLSRKQDTEHGTEESQALLMLWGKL